MNLLDFPLEILIAILSLIWVPKDVFSVMVTCSPFYCVKLKTLDLSIYGCKPIWKATKNRNLACMKFLLSQKTMLYPSFNTPLRYAILLQDVEMIKLLLSDARVDPSEPCNIPLNLATSTDNVEIISLLLRHKNVDPMDTRRAYIFSNAIKNKNFNALKYYITRTSITSKWINFIFKMCKINGYDEILLFMMNIPKIKDVLDYNDFKKKSLL